MASAVLFFASPLPFAASSDSFASIFLPAHITSECDRSRFTMSASPAENEPAPEEEEQFVDPWNVAAGASGTIDYKKLSDKFGCSLLNQEIVDRKGKEGGVLGQGGAGSEARGPSSESLHMGHLVPFMFTKYLQDAFGCPLVIQLTDDEKAIWKGIDIDESRRLARENAKDIIACGFDVNKTFIFSDFEYVGGAFYRNIVRIQRCVPMNQVKGIFGFTTEDYIGKIAFPATQAAPSFPDSFPHMFGTRKDGDSCKMSASVTKTLSSVLQGDSGKMIASGDSGKMSASVTSSAIFVTDTPAEIKNKINKYAFSGGGATLKEHKANGANLDVDINKYAFSGGGATLEEHKANSANLDVDVPSCLNPHHLTLHDPSPSLDQQINKYAFSGGGATLEEHKANGANLDVDVPWKYLNFFLEDDARLETIGKEYGSGQMTTGTVKAELIQVLSDMVGRHQTARAEVTEAQLDAFMADWLPVRRHNALMC
eukprot:gene31871-7079_t